MHDDEHHSQDPDHARSAQGTGASDTAVAIAHTDLSADALRGVIESYIMREGTDYGERECAMDEKIAQVMGQIERGEAHIWFDPESESINIVLTP